MRIFGYCLYTPATYRLLSIKNFSGKRPERIVFIVHQKQHIMKKFLLLLHENIEEMIRLSPEEMEELGNAHMAWAMKLAGAGHLVSGDSLHQKGVLIHGKDCTVKDGPYLESKELVGGYYLLQADDLDTIVEIAKACPCHLWGGTTEIRPVMETGAGGQ